jgi:hypothetical protein
VAARPVEDHRAPDEGTAPESDRRLRLTAGEIRRMRVGHQAPSFFVNVRTEAKLLRRSPADAKRSLSSSADNTSERSPMRPEQARTGFG